MSLLFVCFGFSFFYFFSCENIFNLRILTMNRPKSFERLLNSLIAADYENKTVNLEVFIDFDNDCNCHNVKTLELAKTLKWNMGFKTICLSPKNMGLKRQWLQPYNYSVPFIILEDDLIMSRNYVQAAILSLKYIDDEKLENLFGVSFQKLRLILKNDNCPFFGVKQYLSKNIKKNSVFFIPQMSTWAPLIQSKKWNELINFYQMSLKNESLIHCIPGAISNMWYNTSGTLMQYFFFLKGYFMMYFNIEEHIVYNFLEPGLHFKKGKNKREPFNPYKIQTKLLFNKNYVFDQGFNKVTNFTLVIPSKSTQNMKREEKCKFKNRPIKFYLNKRK